MKKVPYTSNRNYKDLGAGAEEEEVLKSKKEILNVNDLRDLKKSKFESFKSIFKNIFKK